MGNTHPSSVQGPVHADDVTAMFHALDVHGNGYLTLKDLMDSQAPGLMMPHSLPALFFFDHEKNGRLVEEEFNALVQFCQLEKYKVEETLSQDKSFRDLILRASKAGVKDCSMDGRSSYRRLSSYSNIRSVFSNRTTPLNDAASAANSSESSIAPSESITQNSRYDSLSHSPAESSSSDTEPPHPPEQCSPAVQTTSIAMYGSERDCDGVCQPHSDSIDMDRCASDPDLRNPKNRTAVDCAVLENIINTNIHKLADLLHTDGSREKFMAWLWELADFNSTGVVTLEELRVFLAALSEDGIDLSELAFYREGGEPLEVCIINEFDTTHAGLLSRDEFMVLADLVTREYEFWENRHLERIGDYELGRTVGRGSSGVVRLALHLESREKFAIKIVKKGKCSDLSRLDREIQSLMAAKHKHIVGLEEVLESKNNIFIVMELCGGGSMVDIVRLYPEERMPEETARFFVRQVFEALSFCHENGICHRDVRLDNLMLDNAGNAKLTDFGHSGIYTPGWDLFSTSLVGSVYNLSPEQILGQVYSGEKIDVWSAGVAVYCLLVGHPPFHEPEVNLLLERISNCVYDVPDFVSESATDFIQCMIRASPEERIPIQKMLHHPWFYDGPEYGPVMDVVAFPVDAFFRKRPDIAEMILAMTIYQHKLHFHLGDKHNPQSSPEELRGQDWTLRCLCPRTDIKFTVSLFTKKPDAVQRKKKKNGQLPTCASVLTISPTEGAVHDGNGEGGREASMSSPHKAQEKQNSESSDGLSNTPRSRLRMARNGLYAGDVSAARPPLQKALMKVTPMNVAAHLRASESVSALDQDPFDFEPDGSSAGLEIHSFKEEWLLKEESENQRDVTADAKVPCHSRSHSLDTSVGIRRINRSATVDAFPYQKVYPQRKMPESIRNLDFGTPELQESSEDAREEQEGVPPPMQSESAPMTPAVSREDLDEDSDSTTDDQSRPPELCGGREREITKKLVRHPTKAVSPQVPQIGRALSSLEAGVADDMREAKAVDHTVSAVAVGMSVDDSMGPGLVGGGHNSAIAGGELAGKSVDVAVEEIQPFIEVRLQGGESGLFLKICRKLKNICGTKLQAAAERQKKKAGGRRSLTALRRTASARNLASEADMADCAGLLKGLEILSPNVHVYNV